MNYMSGDGTNYAIGSKEIGEILVRVVTITSICSHYFHGSTKTGLNTTLLPNNHFE